jgi:hypothetical protein
MTAAFVQKPALVKTRTGRLVLVPDDSDGGVGRELRNHAKDGMTGDPLSSSATMRAGVVRSTEPEEVPCDDRNGI